MAAAAELDPPGGGVFAVSASLTGCWLEAGWRRHTDARHDDHINIDDGGADAANAKR